MSRFKANDKPNSQKSRHYYNPHDSGPDTKYTSMYSHMLIEDIHLGIMPIGWQPDRFKFECRVEPTSPSVEELLKAGFPTHHGDPRYVTEAICDFVDQTTHILICYGKAFYEIVYTYSDEDKTKIDGFRFNHVYNSNIHSWFGLYWQCIPKAARDRLVDDDEDKKRFIWLPPKHMFVLSFPRQLGGAHRLRKTIDQLAWVSKETIPKFSMKDMELQKQQPGYEFSLYRENQDIFVMKLTKGLGWPARSLSSEKLLEFYQLYRYLRFERAKAILREHIINELNRTLIQVGKKVGFSAKIILDNCYTAKDVEGFISQLIEGKLQFSEILNVTKFQ